MNTMNREANITRFEAEMSRIHRPGIDKLMAYIRKSDFYTAPASTKYHLGFTDTQDILTLSQAIDAQPIIWAMHTADMMASHFMEAEKGNKERFEASEAAAQVEDPADDYDEAAEFQEAPAYDAE